MDLKLSGKTALVTGGSRGIGKAIVRALAEEGVDVAIAARDMIAAQATAKEIASATGRKVIALETDTGDDAKVKTMAAAAKKALGPIDILVNCAAQPGGQAKPPALGEITNEHFWADMNVKVLGYLRTARELTPDMVQRKWGRIINVSGLAARSTGTIIGSMRNVSVAALTKNIADELAGTGVSAICIHPGLTRTEKTPGVAARNAEKLGITPAEAEARMGAQNLTRKLITSEDIAALAVFLASPKSVAINGDVIAAGGGAPGSIHY